jgi:predicted nucleic acid-binding protein
VVTDYVVSETATLAKVRSGARVALRVLDLVEQSVAIRLERIDAPRFDATKAYSAGTRTTATRSSTAPASSSCASSDLTEALTTDGHFAEAGFEALLARR